MRIMFCMQDMHCNTKDEIFPKLFFVVFFFKKNPSMVAIINVLNRINWWVPNALPTYLLSPFNNNVNHSPRCLC